jgi:LysR family transcriptional regulator, regulator for metE and metH
MAPRLGINHLEMLAAIVETGSVAEAAELLGVTPSALSHRIREAERRLDIELFTRLGRRLRLTPAGELLHQAALRLLDELEEVETVAQKMAYGIEAVVRLGIATYSSYHWLPAFLSQLYKLAPEIEVEVVANAVQQPLAALHEGDIDLAVVPDVLRPPGAPALPLFEDELVAIMAPEHRLAAQTFVEAADFRELDVLTYSFTNLPGHEFDLFWRPAGVTPRRIIRVELVEAIVDLVKANLGLAIVQRWAIAPHLETGALHACRLTKDGIRVGWSVVRRAGTSDDTAAARVAAALAEWSARHGFAGSGRGQAASDR